MEEGREEGEAAGQSFNLPLGFVFCLLNPPFTLHCVYGAIPDSIIYIALYDFLFDLSYPVKVLFFLLESSGGFC